MPSWLHSATSCELVARRSFSRSRRAKKPLDHADNGFDGGQGSTDQLHAAQRRRLIVPRTLPFRSRYTFPSIHLQALAIIIG